MELGTLLEPVPTPQGGPPMSDVLLFHHALGVTPGIEDFAAELTAAGHRVEVPDLFDGKVFDTLDQGVSYASGIGFTTIIERGAAVAQGFGDDLVVAGFSLGVLPAQQLAQTRPGVVGAIFYHSAIPAAEFGAVWPRGVSLQLHLGDSDPWAQEDLPAARELAEMAGGELFVYPTAQHLVADSTSEEYDPDIAALILERTLAFLSRG